MVFSLESGVFNPSLEIVVLVAITPSIFVCLTISIISSNWELVRSGAIFKRIGLEFFFVDNELAGIGNQDRTMELIYLEELKWV